MIKRISILLRREGHDRGQFDRHWRDVHGPLVARLPGVLGYVQSIVEEAFAVAGAQPYDIDGIVELYFADGEAMQAAFVGPAAQALLADEPNFLGHATGYVIAGERERVAEPLSRVIAVGTQLPETVERAARELPDALSILRDDVAAIVPKVTMRRGPQPAGAFLHIGFADAEPAHRAGRRLAAQAAGAQAAKGRLSIVRVASRRIV